MLAEHLLSPAMIKGPLLKFMQSIQQLTDKALVSSWISHKSLTKIVIKQASVHGQPS